MDLTIGELFPERSMTALPELKSELGFPFDKVVVTGGAGSIGAVVVRTLIECTDAEVWIIDNDESRLHSIFHSFFEDQKLRIHFYVTDIRDLEGLHLRLNVIKPDVIVHAAALKHVSILEVQVRDAFYTNVIGTQNLIKFLESNPGVGMVFVSSDKAANAKSILGKTKLIGELLVGSLIKADRENGISRFLSVVRFGNVFLSRGSVLETFIKQIHLGEPITITDERMSRYFMDIKEAAGLITHVMNSKTFGISIFKMGEPIMIIDLASRLQNYFKAQNREIRLIGSVSGEKLHEDLFSFEELSHARDLGLIYNTEKIGFLPDADWSNLPRDDFEAKQLIQSIISLSLK